MLSVGRSRSTSRLCPYVARIRPSRCSYRPFGSVWISPRMWFGFRKRNRLFRIETAVMKSRRSIQPFASISRPYRSGKWRRTPAIVRPTESISSSLRRKWVFEAPHMGHISSPR